MESIGIDLGTSGVKAVLVGEDGALRAQADGTARRLPPASPVERAGAGGWWIATEAAMGALRRKADLSDVRGIGLSGQMHGAVLLDVARRVLRPAILWNDGRTAAECVDAGPARPPHRRQSRHARFHRAEAAVGTRPRAGDLFRAIARVLLPKDWLRSASDRAGVSDRCRTPPARCGWMWRRGAGRRRCWRRPASDASAHAARSQRAPSRPARCVGTRRASGACPPAASWPAAAGTMPRRGRAGLRRARAGLPLAGHLGRGLRLRRCVPSGAGARRARLLPLPAATWHRMAVMSVRPRACLTWLAGVSGAASEATLLAELEREGVAAGAGPSSCPYLAGERTPHNDASAQRRVLRAGRRARPAPG